MRLYFFIVFLLIFGCSKNYVYMCGDNPCKNKKEFETYFENNLSVEISFLSEKEKKEVVDLIEYNLGKEKEAVKVASLPKPNKNLDQSKPGKEITEIKRKKKVDTVDKNQPEKKPAIKKTKPIEKINIEQALQKCKVIETCKIEEIYAVILEKTKNKKYPTFTN